MAPKYLSEIARFARQSNVSLNLVDRNSAGKLYRKTSALAFGLAVQHISPKYGIQSLIWIVPVSVLGVLFYLQYDALTWGWLMMLWEDQPKFFVIFCLGLPAAAALQRTMVLASSDTRQIWSYSLIMTAAVSTVFLPIEVAALSNTRPGLATLRILAVLGGCRGAIGLALGVQFHILRKTRDAAFWGRAAAYFASIVILGSAGLITAISGYERSGNIAIAVCNGLGIALMMIGIGYIAVALLFAAKRRLSAAKPDAVIILIGISVLALGQSFDGGRGTQLVIPILLAGGGAGKTAALMPPSN